MISLDTALVCVFVILGLLMLLWNASNPPPPKANWDWERIMKAAKEQKERVKK